MDVDNLLALSSTEIVKWCREQKAKLKVSNQIVSEKSCVPQGTVDRIFSGHYNEFKYNSVQPIIVALLKMGATLPSGETFLELIKQMGMLDDLEGMKGALDAAGKAPADASVDGKAFASADASEPAKQPMFDEIVPPINPYEAEDPDGTGKPMSMDKDYQIAQQRHLINRLRAEVEFLRIENDRKYEQMQAYIKKNEALHDMINKLLEKQGL